MDDVVTVSRNSGADGRKAVIARARLAGAALLAAGLLSIGAAQSAFASQAGFGHLYLDGQIVGTVVAPAHVDPGSGRDPLYMVTNGVSGQLGIAGVGPGIGSYHGGEWQVWTVTFNAGHAPYLLTSADAVMGAAQAGDVTLTRMPDRDFRCPITAG
jgi:hypothetical protein